MADRLKSTIFGYGKSDTGSARDFNGDHYLVANDAVHFAVADGVGDSESGAAASQYVIEKWQKLIMKAHSEHKHLNQQLGQTILKELDSYLVKRKVQNQTDIFATTFSALAFQDTETALLMHAGDSRIYGYESGRIKSLSEEHTLGTELRRQGISIVEPQSDHALVNCLGQMRPDWNEARIIDTQPYEAFLICSDGLSKTVPTRDMEEILTRQKQNPPQCVEALIEHARAAGSKDNVTIVLVTYDRSAQH